MATPNTDPYGNIIGEDDTAELLAFAALRENERLRAINAELVTALGRALEVMEFAYMNAPEQPPEIAEARVAIRKAEER